MANTTPPYRVTQHGVLLVWKSINAFPQTSGAVRSVHGLSLVDFLRAFPVF